MHGSIGKNVSGKWSELKICAINNTIEAYINNKKVGVYVVNKSALCTSGRAAIYSAYENNGFTELEIMPEYFVEKSEKSKEIIIEEKSKEIIIEEKSKEIIIEEKSKEITIEEKSKEILTEEKSKEITRKEEIKEIIRKKESGKEEIKEITRKVNDTSYELEYNGEWDHDFCGSFRNYKRTMSYGKPGSQLSFEFAGEGFMIAGQNESSNTEIEVIIDEMITSKRYILPETWSRGAAYHKFNMPFGNHKVTVTVLKGIMAVDFIEIL